MSRTLTLLCFKQSHFFPQDTAHWALYLSDEHATTGTLFHATKGSLISGWIDYRPIPDINPTASGSLQAAVEIASGLMLTDGELHMQCHEAAQNRPFDLVVNNCQRFCTQILQRLVDNRTITQD